MSNILRLFILFGRFCIVCRCFVESVGALCALLGLCIALPIPLWCPIDCLSIADALSARPGPGAAAPIGHRQSIGNRWGTTGE